MIKKRFLSLLVLLAAVVTGAVAQAAPALNLTSPAVGQVIGDDGQNYDYASLPSGVTAVAKICYVSGEHGLALALADEGQMIWSTAMTTCAAHTPAFTGGTWKVATQDEWNNMITAAGSYTALRDGFSSVGGSNLKKDVYWSSTENEGNSGHAWYYYFDKPNGWYDSDKDYGDMYVRACLAWAEGSDPEPTVAVTGVTLSPTTATLTLGETGTVTLTAIVAPDGATDKSVTWSSSNTSVATVSNEGVVTAVAAGTAIITVTATNGTDVTTDDQTATCTVTVAPAGPTVVASGNCGTTGHESEVIWSFTDDGTLTISGTGAMTDFANANAQPWKDYRSTITSVVVEEGVTTIGTQAFRGFTQMTSVSLPEGLTSIGVRAFQGDNNASFTTITFPSTLTSIENFAFYGCTGLTSVTIGNSVTSIGYAAFIACSGLTSVTIGNSVTSIGGEAFAECSALTSITIPNSVTSIGKSAFAFCTGLTSPVYNDHVFAYMPTSYSGTYTIPDGIESIAGGAFSGCSGLTSITIPNSVTSIGSSAFGGCSGLTSPVYNAHVFAYMPTSYSGTYTIPDGIESIGEAAFYECTGLTSITIPNSVTSIGDLAFRYCSGLETVTILAESLESYGTKAFQGTAEGLKIYVPAGSVDTYKTAWAAYADKIEAIVVNPVQIDGLYYNLDADNMTAEVTSMPSGKYTGDIIIPESVEYYSVTYGVTSIGDEAFNDCHDLTSITIPNSVTSIGGGAFYNCNGLTSIEIPNSVTSIGENAFAQCELTSVTIGNSVTSIGAGAFGMNGHLTSIEIPNSVTSIGGMAFWACGLTSVTIGNSVTSIGGMAFYGCAGLTSVTIPNSVTSIEDEAFGFVPNIVYYGSATGSPWGARSVNGYVDGFLVYSDNTKTNLLACSSQATGTIEIPNSVTSIGDYAFYYCPGITSIEIPSSVTSIGEQAFAGCEGLTSVTIPSSVTSIGDEAFAECSGLETVTILAESLESYGSGAFEGTAEGLKIYVPAESVADYKTAWADYADKIKAIPPAWLLEGDEWDDATKTLTVNSNPGSAAYMGKDVIEHVIISSGVTSIGYEAFYGCKGLTSVTIGNSVTSIGAQAFDSCFGLTSVTIGNSVTSIGAQAFSQCIALTSITIPNSVTSIGGMAFALCIGLESITIPNSVTSIEYGIFAGCASLTSIVVASGNTKYDSRDNCNAIIETATNTLIAGCPNTIIPNSVTSIGFAAFYYCTALTSIEIPNGVTSIGDYAFDGCSGLETVTINATTPPTLGSDAFEGTAEGLKIYVPAGSVDTYKGAWTAYANKIEAITGGDDVTLTDGDTYTRTLDMTVASATYVKSIAEERVGLHQAWLVPFDYTLTSDDMNAFSFYKINMIANAPNPETEASDDIWVFLKRMNEGEVLHANMPYVYRANSAVENYEFTTSNAMLKGKNTGVLATMQTMEETYSLYGTYEGTTATAEDPFYYVNIEGDLSLGNDGTVTVGAFRWIMRVESKFGSTPAYARGIHFVDGEDSETTNISEELRVKSEEFATAEGWYSLDGRRIAQPKKGGLYIVNGRKVVIK